MLLQKLDFFTAQPALLTLDLRQRLLLQSLPLLPQPADVVLPADPMGNR